MYKCVLTLHPGWPCCLSLILTLHSPRCSGFPLLSAGLRHMEGAAPAGPFGDPGPASGPCHTCVCRAGHTKTMSRMLTHCCWFAGLREVEAQDLLSHLAACTNIFLVASMDHVNTPLLWDKQVAARFNWLWYDVTNYVPYTLECAHVPSLLVGRR